MKGLESGRGERSKGRTRRTRARVTERDVEIARWLGRHRLATAEQVMRRFEMHRAKAYARLGVLVESGLVRHEPGIRSKRVYLATKSGLTTTRLRLPPATVSPASFAHDIAAVDVAIDLERQHGDVLFTEREMRASGRRGTFHLSDATTGAVMWPDLVIQLADRHAIEVELTLKTKERLKSKLAAYARSSYRSVTYCTDDGAVAVAVRSAGDLAVLDARLRIASLRPEFAATELAATAVQAATTSGEEIRSLEGALAAARSEMETLRHDRDRQQAFARLIADEILSYLDAGPRGRREVVKRWEREFGSFRRGPGFGRLTGTPHER